MAINKINEKLNNFVNEFNERLPRDVRVSAIPSSSMNNVVNVVVHRLDGVSIMAYGLVQDKDDSIHWFENLTGRLY